MRPTSTILSPYSLLNIKLFIAFRVFFNTRLYYPVFTILFLDYGLTIEQFALLNTVWAMTIVCAEVPSGAMADIIGRKKLLLLTSMFMILELGLIAFVPLGNSTLIFSVFLANRVLSGLAEAMASGADEAIAYDTLVEKGIEKMWPRVLSLQMRVRSVCTIVAVTLGSIIYDSTAVNKILAFCGSETVLGQQTTMRFPVIITFLFGFCAFTAVSMLKEPGEDNKDVHITTARAFKQTWSAAKWIINTPFALAIIIIAMCYDHTIRMIVTMTSEYYRIVGLPDASFGAIGAGMAVIGLFTPKIAERMASCNSARKNIIITGIMGFFGLLGLCFFNIPGGICAMILIFITFTFLSFFTSHYLNSVTASDIRATVLSFKGLAFNLSYGIIGVVFASVLSLLRNNIAGVSPDLSQDIVEKMAFKEAISFFPWYLFVLLIILTLIFRKDLSNEPTTCIRK